MGVLSVRSSRISSLVAGTVLCWMLAIGTGASRAADDLPKSLTDAEFWRMVTAFSEAGGTFPSNNFVSNEVEYQTVIPTLQATVGSGGVYLGVGPDQNFTYITAIKPKIAFIIDIRRQNLLHQLLYKALIERSATRGEFLSRLFSRPKPKDLDDDAAPDTLIRAFSAVPASLELFSANVDEVSRLLVERHKFELSPADLSTIRFIYKAFFDGGPDLTYGGPRTMIFNDRLVSVNVYPTYGDLVMATDAVGVPRGYLSTPDRYKTLRDLEMKNLIVPIVGDFAGPSALRSVGEYLKTRKATVSAIYTSNVEQYLFQNGVWQTYYESVATLPLDRRSTFIRSVFPNQGIRFMVDPRFGGMPSNPVESQSLLCPVIDLLDAVRAGRISNYRDVAYFVKPPTP